MEKYCSYSQVGNVNRRSIYQILGNYQKRLRIPYVFQLHLLIFGLFSASLSLDNKTSKPVTLENFIAGENFGKL